MPLRTRRAAARRRGVAVSVLPVVALPVALAGCTAGDPGAAPDPTGTAAPSTATAPTAGDTGASSGTGSTGTTAGATPGSTASSTRAAPARRPGTFTIAATGDVLVHPPVARRAKAHGAEAGIPYDFRPMFAHVRPVLAGADLALCHLETPLSPNSRDIRFYPSFNSPRELADAFAWAGYDGCSTASNHSLDMGRAGLRATLDVLDRARLRHAGTGRSAAETSRPALYRVRGVQVAQLSYTFGLNGGREAPPDAVRTIDVPRILADARRARKAGARFVVVSMHWGVEYRSAPTAEQRAQARALLRSPDVDLVLGGHAHVQQPVERIGGKFAVYGMGNLLSNQSPARGMPPQTQDGVIVVAHVVPRGNRFVVDRVTTTPTYVELGPFTVWPVRTALADPRLPAPLRAKLRASLARSTAIYRSLPGHAGAATLAAP